MMNQKIGILLINIGTPDAPTEKALKTYLSEFLNDRYVVDYPRWLWKPILEKIILRVRPKKSAALYAKIWTESGSPLLNISKSIAKKLEEKNPEYRVAIGMRYGSPSIKSGLNELQPKNSTDLVIFPLFPQFSSATSLTAIEDVARQINANYHFNKVTTIESYHDHSAYIQSLVESIQEEWASVGKPEKMLYSFHGLPKRYKTKKKDSYFDQCLATAKLISMQLGLKPSEYALSFQSRFGPEPWLTPYTEKSLIKFGSQGCGSIHVICPGFAADCLETLEEIAIQGKDAYIQAGGKGFHYIPALNDSESHIRCLEKIISEVI